MTYLAKRIGTEFEGRVLEIFDPIPKSFASVIRRELPKVVVLHDKNEEIQDHVVRVDVLYWEVICMDAVANRESSISGKLGMNKAFKMTSNIYEYLEETFGDKQMEIFSSIAFTRLKKRFQNEHA